MKRWRAIPLAFRVAVILQLAIFAIDLFGTLTRGGVFDDPSFERWIKLALLTSGLRFASEALFLFGAFELSRLLVGRAGRAAKLAAVAWGVAIAMSFVFMVLRNSYLGWTWIAIMASAGVALAVAAWRVPVVAVGCGLVWIATHLPLERWWFKSLGELGFAKLEAAAQCAGVVALLGLVLAAVGDVPEGFTIPAPQRARIGLSRISSSLWLRVGALIVVPVLTVMLFGGDHHYGEGDQGRNAGKLLGYAAAFAGVINVLAFTLFGLGALDVAGSQHAEIRRWPFLVAAIASLWCGGVTLAQVPELYQLSGSNPGFGAGSFATAFAIVQPLVATTSLIAMAIAIGGFADRRGHLELGARGPRTALLIGMLQLGVLAITNVMLPEVRSTGSLVLIILGALVCGVIATINLARLAGDATVLVEEAPPMVPTAQVV